LLHIERNTVSHYTSSSMKKHCVVSHVKILAAQSQHMSNSPLAGRSTAAPAA
jgi:hypothetical protein